MGNKQVSNHNDLNFISESILCTEPTIRVGIYLCDKKNEPRQGIRVENQSIYGLKHFVNYNQTLTYFFENHIRLIVSKSQLTLFYKSSLFMKKIETYKPILFGNSKELDQIYYIIN
jgi:hypothetical protein